MSVVTIAGAETLLGSELLRVLADSGIEIDELRPIRGGATVEDAPTTVEWRDDEVPLIDSGASAYEGADVAFFAGTQEEAGDAAKLAIARVPLSIDLSGRFADNADVPLVVATVNDAALAALPARALIAVPDAATAMIAAALAPLHAAFGLTGAVLSTYEAVSSLGRAGMDELGRQVRALFNYQTVEGAVFPRTIAFNAIPGVEAREEDGQTRAERALTHGLTRLLPGLASVAATRAWIPAFSGHSAAIVIDTAKPAALAEAIRVLEACDVLDLRNGADDLPVNGDAVGGDDILIGRLRSLGERRLALWVTADNLRRGSAIGAAAIAEARLRGPR